MPPLSSLSPFSLIYYCFCYWCGGFQSQPSKWQYWWQCSKMKDFDWIKDCCWLNRILNSAFCLQGKLLASLSAPTGQLPLAMAYSSWFIGTACVSSKIPPLLTIIKFTCFPALFLSILKAVWLFILINFSFYTQSGPVQWFHWALAYSTYVCLWIYINTTCWVHLWCLCVYGFRADCSALDKQ